MRTRWPFPLNGLATAALGLTLVVAGWVIFSGKSRRLAEGAAAVHRRPAGYPQLVSVEPLPSPSDPMCLWVPASSSMTLAEALQQQSTTSAAVPAAEQARSSADADRAPARVIRDTYPTYSALAVDPNSNEVFLQDENLFGLKVFNRTDNTPPSASFTEPKRILAGLNTKLEFNCAVYIDPKSGDVYSVANDTVDTTVIFPRDAKGNVSPKREIETPHGTWGIAVDEEKQELYLTVQHTNQVVVYRKMAEGKEKPLRTLQGDRTQLEDPHGIAIDTRNQWMFVVNHGNAHTTEAPGTGKFEPPSITVYPLNASGDTAPLRIIEGSQTQLNWPAHLSIHPERGELYVANDAGNSILVFRETDRGDVAPARVIKGSQTGLLNPTGVFVEPKNQELWVSNMGNHSATVYPLTANGDVAPLRTIRSAPRGKVAMAIGNPGAAGYDSKRDQILVPN